MPTWHVHCCPLLYVVSLNAQPPLHQTRAQYMYALLRRPITSRRSRPRRAPRRASHSNPSYPAPAASPGVSADTRAPAPCLPCGNRRSRLPRPPCHPQQQCRLILRPSEQRPHRRSRRSQPYRAVHPSKPVRTTSPRAPQHPEATPPSPGCFHLCVHPTCRTHLDSQTITLRKEKCDRRLS